MGKGYKADPSYHMKVDSSYLIINYSRFDNFWLKEEEFHVRNFQIQLFMECRYSHLINQKLNHNSGNFNFDYLMSSGNIQEKQVRLRNQMERFYLSTKQRNTPNQTFQLFEKTPNAVKTYGIAVRFPSRSNHHNMYKEYRDVSINGAISQMYMELAGRHRVRRKDVAIIRTAVITKKEQCRRKSTKQFFSNSISFPQLRQSTRSESRRFRTLFKASRPTTIKT